MIRFILSIAAALALILPPSAARADPEDVWKACVCRQTLARILCKEPGSFDYLGKRGTRTYIFNVFYGARYSNFVCSVGEDMVRITSEIWVRSQRALMFNFDPVSKCATGRYQNHECGLEENFTCCRPKTFEELEQEKDDAFWIREVPDNLPEPPHPADSEADAVASNETRNSAAHTGSDKPGEAN